MDLENIEQQRPTSEYKLQMILRPRNDKSNKMNPHESGDLFVEHSQVTFCIGSNFKNSL